MSKSSKLAALAAQRANSLVPQWLPKGKKIGREWRVGNIDGEAGDSLGINLETGAWSDFADSNSRGGDLISLKAAIENVSYAEAAQMVASELGIPETARLYTDKTQAIIPVPSDAPSPPVSVGSSHPHRRDFLLSESFEYRSEAGDLIHLVVRYDHVRETSDKGKPRKEVLPLSFHSGGWRYKGTGLNRNPLYGLERLCADLDVPVLLTEGEKTANAASRIFPGYISMTWSGGVGQLRKAQFAPLKGRKLVYWRDADEAGLGSIPIVADLAKEAGVAEVRIVEVPFGMPPGWDLADVVPAGIDIRKLLDSATLIDLHAVKPLHRLSEDELVARLIYNVGTEQFFDPVTGARLAKSQVDTLYKHIDRRGMSNTLLANSDLLKTIRYSYSPGDERRTFLDQSGVLCLNLWRAPEIDPAPGDASVFENHLRFICSTEEQFSFFANCLAFMIQQKGKKLKFAPVIVGPQGTGKSYIVSVMQALLGRHNTTVASSIEVRSDFNEWIAEKELVAIEEMLSLGERGVMNNLKSMITEDNISVNAKHVRRYEIENKANFIFLSNHDDALKIENNDRRYYVIHSDMPAKDPKYYLDLFAWTQQNLGVILNWLLQRDLSKFESNAPAPMTNGKQRMIEAARDPSESLIRDMVENLEEPFDRDLIEVAEAYRLLTNGAQTSSLFLSRPAFQRMLKLAGAINLGQKKAVINDKERRFSLWALRNTRSYQAMSGQALIETYVAYRRPLKT